MTLEELERELGKAAQKFFSPSRRLLPSNCICP